ncbi:MAG: hypothetical protein WCF20_11955 [Methylovirgula sp.]
MDKNVPVTEMMKLVEILEPLSSEDRARVIRAAMVLLGDADTKMSSDKEFESAPQTDDLGTLPARAQMWMKHNSISEEQLQQVFHIAGGGVDIIAAHIPGKSKKEQTLNVYLLVGLKELLLTGNAIFQDKAARSLCESVGCYDAANHSTYIRDRGNEFSGSKDKGWTLTAPGLKRAAEIVRELARAHD